MRAKTTAKTKATKRKYLTIEFAGICALVTVKGSAGAQVWLPNVPLAAPKEGTPHFASLIVRTEEPQSVPADSAVTFPAHPPEYAVWNLRDTAVSFKSDVTSGVTFPKKPVGKNAQSFERLADVWKITSPTALQTKPPLAASIGVDDGEFASLMPPFKGQRYVFYKGNAPTPDELKAAREYAWRFRLRIPFDQYLFVVLQTKGQPDRRLQFKENTSAVIANLCQEVGSQKNHFYAYYGLVSGETYVKIKKKTPKTPPAQGESWPNWEYCFAGRISVE